MKNLTKQEALREAREWWLSLDTEEREDFRINYKNDVLDNESSLHLYLSEHPYIQIVEPLSLFEKCENLWQNLNAFVVLDGKVDMEFLRKVLIDNKPSKQDEGAKHP